MKNINIENDLAKIEVGKCIAYNINVGKYSYHIESIIDIYPCKIGMMVKLAAREVRVNNSFAIAEKNENNYTLSFYRVEKNGEKAKTAQRIETERRPCFVRRFSETEAAFEKGIVEGLNKSL